jgi:hypothetical protein
MRKINTRPGRAAVTRIGGKQSACQKPDDETNKNERRAEFRSTILSLARCLCPGPLPLL